MVKQMIKITGTQMNKLGLYLEGVRIGTLDVDHDCIYLDYTSKEFEERFGKVDLSFEVCNYYDEVEFKDNDVIPTREYTIYYEDEEE